MALAKIQTHSGGVMIYGAFDIDPTCQQVLIGWPWRRHQSRADLWRSVRSAAARPSGNLEGDIVAFSEEGALCLGAGVKLAISMRSHGHIILSQWHPKRDDRCFCARHGGDCPAFPQASPTSK